MPTELADPLDELQNLRELKELYAAREQLRQDFGLLAYRPHKKQDAFHAAGDFRLRMLRAGNRFGKTQMGAAEDSAWMLGERPWYPKGDPRRTVGIPQKPNKILIVTTDWEKVEENFTSEAGGEKRGKLFQLLPKSYIKKTRRNHMGVIEYIEGANGSYVKFDTINSFKHNEQSGESVNWDAIHIDEPCPQKQWEAVARGLMDSNGKAWFTLTPLSEPWINDLFFPDGAEGLIYPHIRGDRTWVEIGTTYDNPHLPVEAIRAYEEEIGEDTAKCRIYGNPLHLSGLVYAAFSKARHVLSCVPHGWKSYDSPPSDYPITVAMDVHPSTNHAVLFCATDPLDNNYLYDEIWAHPSIKELAEMILAKVRNRRLVRVICDPIAWINDPVTGKNMATAFFEAGLPVQKATKAKSAGVMLMDMVFREDPATVRISPKLTRFLWEISRYCNDPKTNKPKDADDHFMENMYRLFYNRPRYFAPSTNAPVEPTELETPSLELDDFDYLTVN